MLNCAQRNGIAGLIAVAMLGGCAANSDRYPSLAIRDFERVQGSFEVAGEAEAFDPPAPANPSAVAQAADLVAVARLAHQEFIDLVPSATEKLLIAESLGPEDYEWTEGQLTLAKLDIQRGKVAILLGDLDLMFANASLSYEELGQIEEARDIVRQLVAQEDEILSSLIESGQ